MGDETTTVESQETTETPQGGDLSPEAKGLLKDLQAERERRKETEQRLLEIEKAQKEAEQKRLEEQEQYKTLYEQEKEARAQEVAELKPLAEQWTGYNEKRRAELLETLGDDATSFQNLGLAELEVVASKLTTKREIPTEPGRPGRGAPGYEGMGWADLSAAIARGDMKARDEIHRRNKLGIR
jgi:hypothetical protein